MASALSLEEFNELLDDYPLVLAKISEIIGKYSIRKYCDGVYLNYYRDGNDWTPNHTHPGTTQLVLSLGATRGFVYGKSTYNVNNGDIVIFGATTHGVPKQPDIKEGRISIALFLAKDKPELEPEPVSAVGSIIYITPQQLIELMSVAIPPAASSPTRKITIKISKK